MGTTIDSGGGTVIQGNVATGGGAFIGRDQNNLFFLDQVNDAARVSEQILAALSGDRDRLKEREVANIVADFDELMQTLSATHKSIVKMISPLRRTPDDPATFADEFRDVYADFRDAYDAHDFLDERTHCHKIRRIHRRLARRKPLFGTEAQWQELDHLLGVLDGADLTLIESRYVPFMEQINAVMNRIKALLDSGATADAVAEKHRFLEDLEPEYTRNKAMLKTMSDTSGTLMALLESSPVA